MLRVALFVSMRECKVCGIDKPLEEYKLTGPNGSRMRTCLDCWRYHRKLKIQQNSTWTDTHLRRRYGITEAQYREMCEKQNHVCAICGEKNTHSCTKKVDYDLYVDHCHDTNKVRGLLCNHCNRGIGLFKDNIENLSKAIEYLSKVR